jgi:hypothetical protein
MLDLITLWERTLGTPPSEQQFVIWTETHASDIVRRAILKTATKNQTMNGTMSLDHKVRFASKVMLTWSAQRQEHAENRMKLAEEFEERVVAEGQRWSAVKSENRGNCEQ